MNDKETIEILAELLEKGILGDKETEAVRSAIGILSWSKLGESRIKNLKAKKERERMGE